jgi:hypothetical protein
MIRSRAGVRRDSLPADGRLELAQVCNLLAALQGWRAPHVRCSPPLSPRTTGFRIGEWIRRLHFLRFGVAFEDDLFLLKFRCLTDGPRRLRLRLVWQSRFLHPEWCVFVHFLDARGEICFQGDHLLGGRRLLDQLGLLYYEVPIDVREEVAPGSYAIRMGIWWPQQQRHLRVYGFRGVRQEAPGWCENAVYVGGCRID